jgi:hypothetical protein
LTTASGTTNYAFYAVNSAKLNFIQTDAAPATAVAGVAELQEDRVYNVSILNGGFAYLVDRPVVVGSGGNADRREFAQVGGWEFDGTGVIVSGVRDDANNTDQNGQNLNPITDITGGYSFAPAGGRGTLHAISLSQQSDRSYVFYMVSQDKMFVLQTLKFAGGTLNAPTGVAERQTGWPYNKNTLNGVYALDASDITATYTDALMRLTFDGLGGIGGIADVAANATVSSAVLNAAYSGFNPNPDASHGRGGIDTNDQVGARNYIFYLVSPQTAWVLGVSPPEVGSLVEQ